MKLLKENWHKRIVIYEIWYRWNNRVNGKRYIVVDKLEENYIWYYNVYEVDDNNNVLDTSLIVKTEVKNGKTLITKTTNEELEKIFKARLN